MPAAPELAASSSRTRGKTRTGVRMLFGEDETLCGRTVLEVGSGRGSSTRELVDLLSGQPGATLIVTDASDSHFARLRQELGGEVSNSTSSEPARASLTA